MEFAAGMGFLQQREPVPECGIVSHLGLIAPPIARQKYWQVLPVGPTSYGDSPYQSFSAFAGNPYFIDLDTLAEEGLLTREEINACYWGCDETQVAYDAAFWYRFPLLKKATNS